MHRAECSPAWRLGERPLGGEHPPLAHSRSPRTAEGCIRLLEAVVPFVFPPNSSVPLSRRRERSLTFPSSGVCAWNQQPSPGRRNNSPGRQSRVLGPPGRGSSFPSLRPCGASQGSASTGDVLRAESSARLGQPSWLQRSPDRGGRLGWGRPHFKKRLLKAMEQLC